MNWLTTLITLVKNPKITEREHDRLIRLARGWPTCACGQLCRKLPRFSNGAPHDDILLIRGNDFLGDIENANWPAALATFRAIEARTAQLLKEGE